MFCKKCASGSEVKECADIFLNANIVDEGKRGDIRMSINEVVGTCHQHGNDSEICISFVHCDEELEVAIVSGSMSLNQSKLCQILESPLDMPDFEAESGRGFPMIKALSKSVTAKEGCLVMAF